MQCASSSTERRRPLLLGDYSSISGACPRSQVGLNFRVKHASYNEIQSGFPKRGGVPLSRAPSILSSHPEKAATDLLARDLFARELGWIGCGGGEDRAPPAPFRPPNWGWVFSGRQNGPHAPGRNSSMSCPSLLCRGISPPPPHPRAPRPSLWGTSCPLLLHAPPSREAAAGAARPCPFDTRLLFSGAAAKRGGGGPATSPPRGLFTEQVDLTSRGTRHRRA